MPLFRREGSGDREQIQQEAALQERSRKAIEAGGLPLRAQERVAAIRAGGDAPVFTSDLSVDEFLLARQSGYYALGLVNGSSVYHIGWTGWTYTGELEAQTRALGGAANSAIDRLRQEAAGMGAIGVIGVLLQITRPGWGESLVEVIALGTAIRARGVPSATEPFLSGLSGQEFWTLLRAGSRPVGLVFGNSAQYVHTNWQDRRRAFSWYNQEMPQYTKSLYQAQHGAFGRMHGQAAQHQAHGIVGVHIEHSLRRIPMRQNDVEYEDYVVEYISWGTAILEAPHADGVAAPAMIREL